MLFLLLFLVCGGMLLLGGEEGLGELGGEEFCAEV